MNAFSSLVKKEERRRDACWAPADRWRAIQETIAWADAQQKIPRNSKAACLEHQRRLLAVSSSH
jgi:hypothetical protein